jgi:hypothetical protein
MRMIAILNSVPEGEHSARPEARLDHDNLRALTVELRGNGLRVAVGLTPHGLTVSTSRLSTEGTEDDDAAWIDDTAVALVPGRPTVISARTDAEVVREESLPY